MNKQAALKQFNQVGVINGVMEASPHALIALQLDGVVQRLNAAQGHMQRNEVAEQGVKISQTIALIDNLRVSVDTSVAGDLPGRLVRLYEHMQARLVEANSESSDAALAEVLALVTEIKTAWDAIGTGQGQ